MDDEFDANRISFHCSSTYSYSLLTISSALKICSETIIKREGGHTRLICYEVGQIVYQRDIVLNSATSAFPVRLVSVNKCHYKYIDFFHSIPFLEQVAHFLPRCCPTSIDNISRLIRFLCFCGIQIAWS